MGSWALDLVCGFWSISVGKVIVPFMAKALSADPAAKTSKRQASSATKCLPLAPNGTLKRFVFQ